jgi:uncharacterized membrane protein YqjE
VLHPSNPESLSSKDLFRELLSDTQLLVQRQVALAKLEARDQIKQELRVAKLLGIGVAVAYAGVILLLVTAALGIGANVASLWMGALIVSVVLLAIAAVVGSIGWARRVRKPLPVSTREVEREITWAKDQVTT